ncbi:MAG: hypothetical protein DI556_04390 [Rhodovulum sulfidophilum]|uniref:Glycosyltransferase 2-like domain-containing protein n=1 Tax=Rhodovulum sulfidophilum TaxID=35806 RepID=A0A2W5ND21_RHOSU|nr:MAG: hypothetical protein DI556_04390 [Rhodovulum sulfidophilum]
MPRDTGLDAAAIPDPLERALLDQRLAALEAASAETAAEIARLRAYGGGVEDGHVAARESLAWRVTEPMRRVGQLLRRRAANRFEPRIATGRLAVEERARRDETLRAIHHLWGGLSATAAPELERIGADPVHAWGDCYDALTKLSAWYAFDGAYADALRTVRAAGALPRERDIGDRLMREGFILEAMGDAEGARGAFARLAARKDRFDPDAALALANYATDDDARLAAINTVLTRAGLDAIRRADLSRPLGLDNLTSDVAPAASDRGRVSVILPCFNAEASIGIALRSLLEQSYRDLEILVVDDCSTDGTAAWAGEFAARDPRVRVIRQAVNAGAYAARNRGLAVATGDFVTTHDADDWSHPRKIERQVERLAKNGGLAGVCGFWVRCREDLRVTPNWRIGRRILFFSHSSFLFRRELVHALGPWDPVRVGADADFIARVRAAKGEKSVANLLSDAPLAFALDAETSLTRTRVTHARSVHFGLRQIYHAVARADRQRPGGPAMTDRTWRHAALPPEALERVEAPAELDHLLIGDCTDPAVLAAMRTEIDRLGAPRIGIFHWPDFAAPPRDLPNAYAMLIAGEGIRAILPGAKVRLAARVGIFFGADHAPVDQPFEFVD